ncbi:MAG: hypothetical protein RR450_05015 [Oscillospiraceae bacterium]
MDGKNRTIFALLIAVIIAVAVISSFGFNFFGGTPSVALPDMSAMPTQSDTPSGGAPLGDYVKVEVTADTVQSVIVTLARPESYSRRVLTETFGNGTAVGTVNAEVLADAGWTQVTATLQNGQTEHSLVGESDLYLWYNHEKKVQHFKADGASADLAQRIPTYEDVLALEKADITATGYEERGGVACIYVETYVDELGQYERYWVSVNTGLLVSSETVKDERLVYRMTAYEVVVPAVPGTVFALPDGTAIHKVGG